MADAAHPSNLPARAPGDATPRQRGSAVGGARARAVADHLGFVLDALHHHHTNEDDMVWPLLRERAGLDAPLVARMEQQHHQVDSAVAGVRDAVSAWVERPTADRSASLTAALSELIELLDAHLDEEERDVVPLIDRHLTREEWTAMGRAGFEKFAPAERSIAMGQMLDVATEEEARRMFAELPLPVRVLWWVAGRRQYRRHVRAVWGRPENPVLRRLFRVANTLSVRAYRRSGGRRGGAVKGLPVLLVTVRGRRTGVDRTTAVAYFDIDGSYLVCGSAGGAQSEPQWFRNLRRVDRATVQIGADTHLVDVSVPERAERDRLWDEIVLPRAPFFAKYEQKSRRLMPLAVLTPVGRA